MTKAVSLVNGELQEVEIPAGSGDVVGPVSSTDNTIVVFDGLTGKLIKEGSFASLRNTTTPNTTVPVHAFSAQGAEANIDVAIVPKGTGAFSLAVPNGAVSGGNKRGVNAIDLQTSRVSADEVASGSQSVLLGSRSRASGTRSVAIGTSATSTNFTSIALGTNATALADYGMAVMNATTRNIVGYYAYGHGNTSVSNRHQRGELLLFRTTTSATPDNLATDSSSIGVTNQLSLSSNMASIFSGQVLARDINTGDTKAWHVKGCFKMGATSSTTTLVGSPIIDLVAQDAAASTWNLQIVASPDGYVRFAITGEAAKTIRWTACIQSTEGA